jgi:hypothetical protein
LFFPWDGVSLCNAGWPWIDDPSAFTSWILGLQACVFLFSCLFWFGLVCSTGAWTQYSLPLEPYLQSFCFQIFRKGLTLTLSRLVLNHDPPTSTSWEAETTGHALCLPCFWDRISPTFSWADLGLKFSCPSLLSRYRYRYRHAPPHTASIVLF